ncbi:hypothetical protein [Pararobbsia silviterrae]|uniref:hypothetical protein n=1 Tax=Pararobbsia silviterrae TaxID=1792498 RepID=UPI001313FFF4|nr:hypothetical protein [Pararobbsia silviterrae]
MSKRSREKHARPAFEPIDSGTPDDESKCAECGFFEKEPGRDLCTECIGMERACAAEHD